MDTLRRLSYVLLGVIATVGTTIVVLVSPILFTRFTFVDSKEWSTLSNIGQSYGAIAALLTALTFIGLVSGLVYQGRQVHAQRQQSVRSFHFELIKLNLENNDLYGPSWGPQELLSPQQRLRHLYTNQVMLYLSMGYDSGIINEAHARGILTDIFHGQVGREYWETAGPVMLGEDRNTFNIMVQQEFERAVRLGPGVVLEEPSSSARRAPNGPALFFGGAALALALRSVLSSRLLMRERK